MKMEEMRLSGPDNTKLEVNYVKTLTMFRSTVAWKVKVGGDDFPCLLAKYQSVKGWILMELSGSNHWTNIYIFGVYLIQDGHSNLENKSVSVSQKLS